MLFIRLTNKAEVLKLQQFLVANGYLNVSPTGNYLGLTQKAVAAFQKANGITPAAGYFGPLTRAAVNSKLAGATGPAATVSVQSVTKSTNTASAILANNRTVTWQTNNYPQGVGVNINLLRKSVGTPSTYSLIRTVAKDTANNGAQTFTLQNSELGGDVYVEVTCSSTYQFKAGCSLGSSVTKVN
jgi:peptidoglycan hydrolase-like protein with peptidoglycan-binding domain